MKLEEYLVSWRHVNPHTLTDTRSKKAAVKSEKTGELEMPGTHCYVKDLKGNLIASSFCKLHYKDKFEKLKGREFSLIKVIKGSTILPNTLIKKAFDESI
jgi:hypothetical protein